MANRVADRLQSARRRQFVGRSAELQMLERLVRHEDWPIAAVYIHGPGGVGKSTLLGRFGESCESAGIQTVLLDSRSIDLTPRAFVAALSQVLGLGEDADPVSALHSNNNKLAILIDTVELLSALEGWLFRSFMPELPSSVLVVMAGRDLPAAAWRQDPGWRDLLKVVTLRNLEPSESADYLALRGVPTSQHETVLAFTHGHPLALSLIGDVFAQRPEFQFRPDASPDLIRALLENLVQLVPGPAHRAALEVCALCRITTEPLISNALGIAECRDLFDWLSSLSFMEKGPFGLYPHDLAREALLADLRWRNPDWHAALFKRAGEYYHNRFVETAGRDQQRALLDYIFLARSNPLVQPFVSWDGITEVFLDTARAADYPAILAMAEKYEGPESAKVLSQWLDQDRCALTVVRRSDSPRDEPAGFMCALSVGQDADDQHCSDPGVRAVWEGLRGSAPLRQGEHATLYRFWMSAEGYQGVTPAQSLMLVSMVRHFLTTRSLAYGLIACSDPDFWSPVAQFGELRRFDADFSVGDRTYGVYGQDWRALPPMTWLARVAAKAQSVSDDALPDLPREAVVVLSRQDFDKAVRDALREMTSASGLAGNPLLKSRLVRSAGGSGGGDSLRAALADAIQRVEASPRQEKLGRVLMRTFLSPAATQEQAAEILDLPFSTYRRYLARGIEAVADILWESEVAAGC